MTESLTPEEFNYLRIQAFIRLTDKMAELGGGTFSTVVERAPDGKLWVIVAHMIEGEIGRFRAIDLIDKT